MTNIPGSKVMPAVFLDRDGTIIEDRGHLSDPSQVVFFDDTVAALRCLAEHFMLFMVTNQGGVARGIITLEEANRVNQYVVDQLEKSGITIAATYVCPHWRDENCHCIKPKPHFLRKAEQAFGIDLARSFTVGDHPHDVEFGTGVGATGIFVLTGHGMHHKDELPPGTPVARGIREAVDTILSSVE